MIVKEGRAGLGWAGFGVGHTQRFGVIILGSKGDLFIVDIPH
jgi:hypothetical protein